MRRDFQIDVGLPGSERKRTSGVKHDVSVTCVRTQRETHLTEAESDPINLQHESLKHVEVSTPKRFSTITVFRITRGKRPQMWTLCVEG